MLVRNILFNDVFISYVIIRLLELSLPMINDYDFKLEYSPIITAFKNIADKIRLVELINKII